jgi:hypothetical protein
MLYTCYNTLADHSVSFEECKCICINFQNAFYGKMMDGTGKQQFNMDSELQCESDIPHIHRVLL